MARNKLISFKAFIEELNKVHVNNFSFKLNKDITLKISCNAVNEICKSLLVKIVVVALVFIHSKDNRFNIKVRIYNTNFKKPVLYSHINANKASEAVLASYKFCDYIELNTSIAHLDLTIDLKSITSTSFNNTLHFTQFKNK